MGTVSRRRTFASVVAEERNGDVFSVGLPLYERKNKQWEPGDYGDAQGSADDALAFVSGIAQANQKPVQGAALR